MCQNQTYTYAYDLRGNRIAETGKKESREYVYDETNRLVEGTNWKGDKSAYTYNGLGVRINNTHTTHSGSERIEQFTDRSRGGYERLLYVHEDLQGNTRYYTKANGQSFAELTYDAWGMPESPNKLLNNDHGNYVYATYTGHIFDTTLDIYFCEARFYDASTRTWMAMDPVKDGGNWYQYVYSNPIAYMDPNGLWVIAVGGAFAAGALISMGEGTQLIYNPLTGDIALFAFSTKGASGNVYEMMQNTLNSIWNLFKKVTGYFKILTGCS